MYLEHANISVNDIDEAVSFFQTAFPNFKIRGQGGESDQDRWIHIGTDDTYIALQNADNKTTSTAYSNIGINHIGFVVENVDNIAQRLEEKGYKKSYPRQEEKYRKRIYYYDGSGNEYEFVEYLSNDPSKKNLYT